MNRLLKALIVIMALSGCSIDHQSTEISRKVQKPESWQLVWQEEFDYTGLPNPEIWSFQTDGNATGWGNGEDQYYTDSRLENCRVDQGILNITALKEDYAEGFHYSSARISTRHRADFLYGRFEIRAKLPTGQGIWPAIWMMPSDSIYGGWPDSGEIDIMEYFGWLPDDRITSNIHTSAYNHKIGTGKGGKVYDETAFDQFHLYILEWTPDSLSFYLDDQAIFSYQKPSDDWREWPYDQPFYFILNNAVGGDWCRESGGIDDSIFPQVFQIDYIRVYEGLYPGQNRLTLEPSPGGNLEVSPEKKLYDNGDVVHLNALPRKGYRFSGWTGDLSGSDPQQDIMMGRDKQISAIFVRENEMLRNGSFQYGMEGWSKWVDSGSADAEFSINGNTLQVDVKKAGPWSWQAQLNQPLSLEPGQSYTLSFRARSEEEQNLHITLSRAYDPYNSFWNSDLQLENEWRTYNFDIKLEDGDAQSRLEFDLGLEKGLLQIDDISLEKL